MAGWGVNDYPTPPEQPEIICPVCGFDCYTLYTKDGEVVGCDNCIEEHDAYEWWDDHRERDEERNE